MAPNIRGSASHGPVGSFAYLGAHPAHRLISRVVSPARNATFCFVVRFRHAEGLAPCGGYVMKKLMIGLAAAGFGALLAIGGAQAQDTNIGTGTGADARMKNAPTAAAMGRKGGMKMRHYRRHHARHYCRHM